jgi:hypothetical protein
MEVRNATIESATITCDDPGLLSCSLHLDYGDGSFQGFGGGYALYLPKSYKHHAINSPAGHFIFRMMELAGVTSWDKMRGRTVRVRGDGVRIVSLGHITKNDWFTPETELKG